MDPLDWISSHVSDGIDWLFKDGHWINAAKDAASVFSTSSTAASKALLGKPPEAPEKSIRSGPGFRSSQIASGRPAPVHGQDVRVFNAKTDDPWMYTFRSVVNRNQQAVQ